MMVERYWGMFTMKMFCAAMAASLLAVSSPSYGNDQIKTELANAQARLDPVSFQILQTNQELWIESNQLINTRISTLIENGEVPKAEAEEIRQALVAQRVSFIKDLSIDTPSNIAGGWSDGSREILLDITETEPNLSPRGKLASLGRGINGERVFCVVTGTISKKTDGLSLVPDNALNRPIEIRRMGIALSISELSKEQADASPLCPAGTSITGQFFHIKGAEAIIPFLMR